MVSQSNSPVDERFMQRAQELAAQGVGATNPNPSVGCVIVRDGRVVGEGWHRRAGGPHAEAEALAVAGAKARAATAYVTLEPCSPHPKRTPPCALALATAGIRRVVVALRDPNPLVRGRGIAQLRRSGVEVLVGLLADQTRRMNEAYVLSCREQTALRAAQGRYHSRRPHRDVRGRLEVDHKRSASQRSASLAGTVRRRPRRCGHSPRRRSAPPAPASASTAVPAGRARLYPPPAGYGAAGPDGPCLARCRALHEPGLDPPPAAGDSRGRGRGASRARAAYTSARSSKSSAGAACAA